MTNVKRMNELPFYICGQSHYMRPELELDGAAFNRA